MKKRNAEAARRATKKYRLAHLEKVAAYQRRYRATHRMELRAYDRKLYARLKTRKRFSWLKSKYGITENQFNVLLAKQNNLCAICFQPFDSVPHVDHDHATGRLRGLTCSFCNHALGLFRDNPTVLRRAAEYLESKEDIRVSCPEKPSQQELYVETTSELIN